MTVMTLETAVIGLPKCRTAIGDHEPFGQRKQLNDLVWRVPKAERPLRGAKCRTGKPCQMRTVEGRKRCRLHGGASIEPKYEAGRQAIAESNRRRVRPACQKSGSPTRGSGVACGGIAGTGGVFDLRATFTGGKQRIGSEIPT
jgi:hypothetical protein